MTLSNTSHYFLVPIKKEMLSLSNYDIRDFCGMVISKRLLFFNSYQNLRVYYYESVTTHACTVTLSVLFRTHIIGSIITSSNYSDYYSKNLKI